MISHASRHSIYYWKCDRAAAFHGTQQGVARQRPELAEAVRALLMEHLGPVTALRDGGGQGNHLTFIGTVGTRDYFVRIEDGPEGDDYIAVESFVMAQVRACGVPTPEVYASDARRQSYPFAWQILEHVPQADMNEHLKAGTLDQPRVAAELGRLIARWQRVPVTGFGPFDVAQVVGEGRLRGWHVAYSNYHYTRLDAHLDFLTQREFLTAAKAAEIRCAFDEHRPLLALTAPVLVHKDLALWNVLGTEQKISAVIDWDDCIGGDPMDDLALLGCFHDGSFLRAAFAGYESEENFPPDHLSRFWLHLLRNMLFKAVIRLGAGYFNHDSGFFLNSATKGRRSLREETLWRIDAAFSALRDPRDPFTL